MTSDSLKVVVRKKKNAKRKLVSRSKGGLPTIHLKEDVGTSVATLPEATLQNHNDDNDLLDSPFPMDDGDIPCDSLLALRSLVQANRCLYIPLHVGMIPCILESQVYGILKSEDGSDSVATIELRELMSTHKLRQLISHNGLDGIEVLVESHHYVRAVWDAHRHSQVSCPKVTTWFLSALRSSTGRTVARDQLEQAWNDYDNDSLSFAEALDKLVQMQVLLPTKHEQSYLFWLPHWGTVLQDVEKAKSRVIMQIKRSHYKEIPQLQLEHQNFPGMSSKFILDWMLSQGFVSLHSKPSGVFIRLPAKDR
jgi:hypothetical protein